MASEENKAVVRRFVDEVQSKHRMDLVNELFSPEFVDHAVPQGMAPQRGTDHFKAFYGGMLRAFPDVRFTIVEQVAEGDKVATIKTARATHRGEFMGVGPTGNEVELPVVDVFRVAEGKLVEHWGAWDNLSLLQQIGATSTPRWERAERGRQTD